jgi:hypothetical protein
MNILVRAIHWVFGNGYDLSADEDTVVRHKEGAKKCMRESQGHFSRMQQKFNDVTPDPDAEKDSLDEHPSAGHCFSR